MFVYLFVRFINFSRHHLISPFFVCLFVRFISFSLHRLISLFFICLFVCLVVCAFVPSVPTGIAFVHAAPTAQMARLHSCSPLLQPPGDHVQRPETDRYYTKLSQGMSGRGKTPVRLPGASEFLCRASRSS